MSRDEQDDGRLPENGTDGSDEVADLIRLAGKLPPVPADEIARIRTATYAAWKDKVGYAADRRWHRGWQMAALATAATVALGVGFWVWQQGRFGAGAAALPATARVQSVAGMAWVQGPDLARPRHPAVAGTLVPVGAEITTSSEARMALVMPTGHSIRLDIASSAVMRSSSSLTLESGAAYVDSGPDRLRDGLTIVTPVGEIRDIGTQFETRLLETAVRVRVREGIVRFAHDEADHEVQAGTQLQVATDGSVSRTDTPVFGPDWQWVEAATPPIDIQGRPLLEFLEWIARERGWRLEFASPATRDQASTIIVSGSIEGLTLDQALAAVLGTCRLTHDVEQGVLLIR